LLLSDRLEQPGVITVRRSFNATNNQKPTTDN